MAGDKQPEWLPGVYYYPAAHSSGYYGLILSCGVHGDETAPIECLSQLKRQLQQQPQLVKVPVLLIFANLGAIDQGKRMLQQNMNRLFNLPHQRTATAAPSGEQRRAQDLQVCCQRFADLTRPGQLLHLDLHSTIKPSLHPTFALQPQDRPPYQSPFWHRLISHTAISAWVRQTRPAHTFSQYSYQCLGAESITLELGQLNHSDANQILPMLSAFIGIGDTTTARAHPNPNAGKPLAHFRVYDDIIKQTEAFEFSVDEAAPNFSPIHKGQLIYCDGGVEVRAEKPLAGLFFNSRVAPGQRAGLLLEAI